MQAFMTMYVMLIITTSLHYQTTLHTTKYEVQPDRQQQGFPPYLGSLVN